MVGSLFINRELSWIDFNERVLHLAEERSIPLLERLKFVAIFSSNLDEFFQVRVGALHDMQESDPSLRSFDGMTAPDTLRRIKQKVEVLCSKRDAILSALLRELEQQGLHLCRSGDLSTAETTFLDQWFNSRILPVLTPLAVDPAHPFPYISNLALNLGVDVTDPETGESRFARVKVPAVDRFVHLGSQRWIAIEEVIANRIGWLFPGMNVSPAHYFRVTRNTDLSIDADEAEDLLETVEMELRRRRFGNAVRLEVEHGIEPAMLDLLLTELGLEPIDVYRHERLLAANDLWELHRINRDDLRDEPWRSVTAGRLWAAEAKGENFFQVIAHRDLMVHHPYESFSTSTDEFIRQASEDPSVRAIKATLYRTSSDSPLAKNLVRAAERGVQVAVLVELTARFDEQTNVQWARELERAGAHVVYGLVGLKTHAKCLLVVREETNGLRTYAHIGTGNYNSTTSRVYEDIGVFTCDPVITNDVASLFNHLTGYSKSPGFRDIVTAPKDLRTHIVGLIRNEKSHGPEGRISMKVNSLVDDGIISELAAAAREGVHVDLLVRGITSMSLSTISDASVRVRSVLGRFLEHSRIYRFGHGNNGGPAYFIGSADMMTRNLDLRIEILVPIKHEKHRAWLDKVLEIMWDDDVVRFELEADDTWRRRGPSEFTFDHDAQGRLMKWATQLQLSQGAPSPYDVDEETDPAGLVRPLRSTLARIFGHEHQNFGRR